MDLFVDGKFLTIFAFLFGAGIAQQWRRAEIAGLHPLPLHVRRMGFLFAVGLLHALLLRNGDILAPYALLGLTLLGFRRRSSSTIAMAIVLLLVVPFAIGWLVPALGLPWPERPDSTGRGYLRENLAWLRYWYATNPFVSWPHVLALMLAGLVAGGAGLIQRVATRAAVAGRLLAGALPLAVLTRLAVEMLRLRWPDATDLAQALTLNFTYQVSTWTLAAVYVAVLMLVWQHSTLRTGLDPLRAVGRMAFTNYLLQPVLVVPFCLTFGLFDEITPTRGLMLAAAVATIQLGFSSWWLSRHPMGPMERVWRAVTYGSSHPERRPERSATLAAP